MPYAKYIIVLFKFPLKMSKRFGQSWKLLKTTSIGSQRVAFFPVERNTTDSLAYIQAKKFLSDLSPSYMQARTVLRQLQRHLGPLFPPPPPSSSSRPYLYLPPKPTFNAAERALVGAWKSYLRWEESNPLEIDEQDRNTFITRVQGVYRKAVIRMRFFGEIW